MIRNDTEIVAALHRALAGKVGPERFAVWFGRGVRMEPCGKTLRIAAADTRLHFIRRNFHSELDEAASLIGVELEFIVDPSVAADVVPRDASRLPHWNRAASAQDGSAQDGSGDENAIPAQRAAIIPAAAQFHRPGRDNEPAPKRDPRHEFANLAAFLPGPSNLVALSAAQTVAATPGAYNPLTFVGPPGSGKTHLLQGIWRHVRSSGRLARALYLTSEQFTNSFLEALRSGMPSFRAKIRDAELLLIDDADFFLGKQSTLIEIVHTIDAFVRNKRQIVFSIDRPLSELKAIAPELAARLASGLICQLLPADFAVRQGILQQLVARLQMAVPQDVIDWIAAQLGGDARELAGALNTLKAESEARMHPIDLPFAQDKLADLILANRPAVRLPDIVDAVCECLGVESSELQSSSKAAHVTAPRMLVMFLARKWTRAALSEISRSVGRKSHSTVLSAEQKVTQWLATGKTLPLARGQWRIEDAIKRVEGQLRLA